MFAYALTIGLTAMTNVCAGLRYPPFTDLRGQIDEALRHGLARAMLHQLRLVIFERNLLESNWLTQHFAHDTGHIVA